MSSDKLDKKPDGPSIAPSPNRASRGVNNAFAGDEAEQQGMIIAQSTLERSDREAFILSKLLAEFAGTFFLVLTIGVSVHSGTQVAPAAIGLVLSIQIYSYGSVSGGMFNPAVTLAVLLSRRDKIKPDVALMYIGVQLLAGFASGVFAFAVSRTSFGFTWEEDSNCNAGTSWLLEAVYTAALCSTVLAAGTSFDAPNQYYGFAIGLTVMSSAYTCSGFCAGSFNPAVTLGINMGNLINTNRAKTPGFGAWCLHLLTPFVGSFIAAGIFRLTRGEEYKQRVFKLYEKLLSEFVGTFYLVFTISVAVAGGGGGYAEVAIGMMLGIQIYTFGSVSGGLFNPAVAVAVLLSGRNKIQPLDVLFYIGMQLLGAIVAGFLAFAATQKTFCFDYDLTVGGAGSSFLLEVFFTTALCCTVLTTGTSLDAPNHYFGFAIGTTVTVGAATSVKYDQGSFNPAVTIGVNLANYANSNSTSNPSAGSWFLFLLAPLCGSVIAAGIFRGTRIKEYKYSHNVQVGNKAPAEAVGNKYKRNFDTE